MALYAIINQQTNKVVNVCEWDGVSNFQAPVGHILFLHSAPWIGADYDPSNTVLSVKPSEPE